MNRFVTVLMHTCVALVAVSGIAAPGAAATPALPGVPNYASLLFALESRSGTLAPDARAGKGHFTLTLKGVERRATWFTDRPQRDAGRVNSRKLFRAWRRLGFRASPPNAALVVDGARSSRDTIAAELQLRSYDKRRGGVSFAVRTLGSLGGGLRHINRHIDGRLPRRFAGASLFIDNADFTDCPVGQPQLFAFDEDVNPSQMQVESMIPADGRTLPIAENADLFWRLGFRFGGDGSTTFALPDMNAPESNLAWFICAEGWVPDERRLGANQTPACETGEVDFWILPEPFAGGDAHHAWWPADGRTVPAGEVPTYSRILFGSGQNDLQLPNVPAPEGMQSLVCLFSTPNFLPRRMLGQANLFAGTAPPGWMPARGQELSTYLSPGLYSLLNPSSAHSRPTFELPALQAPAAGVEYNIATDGAWPLGTGY